MAAIGLPPPPIYSSDEDNDNDTQPTNISSIISPSNTTPLANNVKCPSTYQSPPTLIKQQFTIPIHTSLTNPIQSKTNSIRSKAINELISTEETYINNLKRLINLYSIPLSKNEKLLSFKNHSIIFPNIIKSIIKLNETLLKSMQSNGEYIGQSMLLFIPYLKMYSNYMKNYENTTQLLSKIRTNNSRFNKFCDLQKMECNNLTLESYLILPIQRIPRYELCLKEIIKYTNHIHFDKKNLIKCYNKIKNLNGEINTKLKQYEYKSKVNEFEKKINGLNFNLVTPSREYIFDGFIHKISRKKDIKYLFILFNDILIYCQSDENKNKLIFHRKLEMDEYFQIKPICYLNDENNNNNNCKCYFEIRSLEKSFLCYTQNVNQREKWIDLINQCLLSNNNHQRNDDYVRHRKSIAEINNGRILETAPILKCNNDTNICMIPNCNNKLGIIGLRKKYHCTYCGKIVCNNCCKNMLKHFNPKKRNKKKRVCDICYNEHKIPYFLNVDQMNFVSKNITINNNQNNNEIKEENDCDLWDKYKFENNNNNINNEQINDIFDGLFNDNTKKSNDDPFADLWNVNNNNGNNKKMEIKYDLDYSNENVQNLRMFGFCENDINKAWKLMKRDKTNKNITPNNGHLFVQYMLDYLQKI